MAPLVGALVDVVLHQALFPGKVSTVVPAVEGQRPVPGKLRYLIDNATEPATIT